MPRKPCPRAAATENRAFLRHLTLPGNARAAAREVGRAFSTMIHRRKTDPAFAQRWDASLASAQARLHAAGGLKGPEARGPAGAGATRTAGGEPVVVRVRGGRIQVRAAHPGKLTAAAVQAFLAALSATANVALSARAAGASQAAFYRRKRRDPAFAREWALALEQGYARVELALLESATADAYEGDEWRWNDPPAIPPMTANQALQLMYLHQKEVMGLHEPPHLKPRRGESREAHAYRLAVMHEVRLEREREKYRVAEAQRAAGTWVPKAERPPKLPDLAQVTGWSKADLLKAAHDEGRALFGGWRIEDMERKRRGG